LLERPFENTGVVLIIFYDNDIQYRGNYHRAVL